MRFLLVALLALSIGGASARSDVATAVIYVVSAAGGDRQALTSGELAIQPSLSPDGKSIAFNSSAGIRVINTDASGERGLGAAGGERPLWSPGGRSLAYTGANSDRCIPPAQKCVVAEVWTVNADGTGVRKVFGTAVHPVWSPSGRLLAFRDFVVGESGDVVGRLKVARPDGSHVRTLFRGTALDGVHSLPAWSPNGKWIAFNAWRANGHRVFLVRADGSGLRRLANGTYPSWSPNGKLIAFERNRSVWVIPAAGGPARRLSADGRCPTWSPSGRQIAFLTNGAPGSLLEVVRPDGRGKRVLARAADCYAYGWSEPSPPVWSRDGGSIYFVG